MQDRCTCSPAGLCLPRKKTTVTAPAWLGFWSLDEQTLPATVPPTPGVPAVPDPARPTWRAALPSPTPDLSHSWPPGPWFAKALGIGPVGEESTTLVWLPLAAASKAQTRSQLRGRPPKAGDGEPRLRRHFLSHHPGTGQPGSKVQVGWHEAGPCRSAGLPSCVTAVLAHGMNTPRVCCACPCGWPWPLLAQSAGETGTLGYQSQPRIRGGSAGWG